jgi:predicted secreted protein
MMLLRFFVLVLVAPVLSGATACSSETPADKPAAPAAVTFKPIAPGDAVPTPTAAAPMVGGPGQPAAMVTDMATGWPITLQVGQDVMVRLSADRASGLTWVPKEGAVILTPGEATWEPASGGVGGTEVYRVRAVKVGQAALVFEYRKKDDAGAAPVRTVTYQVTVK